VIAARAFLSVALLCGSVPTALAQSAPPAPQASRWHLDGATDRCVLTRELNGPAGAATFVLRTIPGSGRYEVLLAGGQLADNFRRRAEVARIGFGTGPDMAEAAVSAIDLPGRLGRGLVVGPLGRDFVASFAKGSALRLAGKDGRELGSWTVPTGAKAAEAMAFCELEKQVEWGADRALFAPGATPPRPMKDPRTWVTRRDFGISQAYTSAIYTAMFRMTVDETGKASACSLMEYAGNVPEAKTHLCNALMSSARFEPARDAAGKPIRSIFINGITVETNTEFR
jgi:hypothetical protein